MNNIKVLDCTLRDGGYVNNWEFGQENARLMLRLLEASKADVIELGFMRNESYRPDRAIFNSIDQVSRFIGKKDEKVLYSVLVEMANYFPPEMLQPVCPDGPDIIRYSFWKRKIEDAFDYCRKIVEKGYRLGVQPTRVEQYSEEEFAQMCIHFSTLKPYAIYIVDTFGLLEKNDVIRYAEIADEYVGDNIRIGYHSHNNMGQAFANATAFAERNWKHDIILDASVFGMGRGAGNLNHEMIANYLNCNNGKQYNRIPLYQIWDLVLCDIYKKLPWGYHIIYFCAAANHCNPNYATELIKAGIPTAEAYQIISGITGEDKYLFNREMIEERMNQFFSQCSTGTL